MTETPDDPPADVPPWDEPTFVSLLEGLVADCAPRLFALVEEAGERLDGRIVAWGLQFADRAEVVGADRGLSASFRSADSAHRLFGLRATTRLVWYRPEAAVLSGAAA
ncbi:MAG: hypothetical protein M3Z25_18985 [Actinomycetota bacterium]|nr:hypothetical protein [Actinomycetota bacterium]